MKESRAPNPTGLKIAYYVGKALAWILAISITTLLLGWIAAIIINTGGTENQKSAQTTSPVYDAPPTHPSVPELLRLVNIERAKVGVAPLALDDKLNESAQYKADDMASLNYFGHESPTTHSKNGLDKAIELTEKSCSYVSENLTDNVNDSYNTSQHAVESWLQSTPHYTAMVSPIYQTTGFGISGTKIVEHFCQLR